VAEAERRGAVDVHRAATARVVEAKREAATYHGKRGTSLEAASKAEKLARRAHADAERLGVIAAQADEAARVRGDLGHQLDELAEAARGDAAIRASVEAARAESTVRHGERARVVGELRRAAGHAHARSELVAGDPCPLCGAIEHPWSARDGFDQLVVEAEDRLAEAVGELEEARGELAAIAARDNQRAKDRKRIAACVATADGAVAAARATWREQLASLGELGFVDDPASTAARELARERTGAAWAKVEAAAAARSQAEAAATASADAQARVEQRQAEAEQGAAAVGGRDARLVELAAELERAHAARAAKLERRAEAELAAERAIAEHEARGLDAAARAEAFARELAAARGALDVARAEARLATAELHRLLADDPARTDALADQLAELERAADRARTLVAERRRLADDHAGARPPALDDAARASELAAAVAAADQRAAALAAALAADDDARVRRTAALAVLAEAEHAAEVDRVLGAVIGSHDGKLFRSFAQSLTLDGLLAVANSHLDELAPRYQLERVPKHDLELQVIDRDLGGEVRSVQSLSGGESFLVSLALALGLSSMSAHDVRVRTLLIDEGFGTLDPATLDSALAVLDALQATGRQVGVISHVPQLVERVGAHVRVAPRGGGKSEVSVHSA
jgi:exonuclease SbcC